MEKWIKEYIKIIGNVKLKSEKIEDAFLIKYEHIPDKLYRFRPCNKYALDCLFNSQLYLSSPSNFNDPYDAKPLFNPDIVVELALMNKYVKNCLCKIVGTDDIHSKLFIGRVKKLMSKLQNLLIQENEKLGIACFSENDYSNILMWSHYADCHKGFCLEYDYSKIESENNLTRFICPVVYSDKIYDLSKHIFMMIKSYAHPNKPSFNNIVNMSIVPLYKSKEWSYEKEWRLVYNKELLKINNPCIDFIKPCAIYLGTNIQSKYRSALINYAKTKNIDIFDVLQKGNEYKLVQQKIN